jgi:hypothetical protein
LYVLDFGLSSSLSGGVAGTSPLEGSVVKTLDWFEAAKRREP